jgi:aspartate ammonia-lyase
VSKAEHAVVGSQRSEHDLLGERQLPGDAYYGIHTLRAVENFPITDIPISAYPDMVNALAAVKEAAAGANRDLGLLDRDKAEAICTACREIRAGQLHESFIVDVIQGGAGTSANMNANEVIANRALEHLGRRRGDYGALHPLDDVNRSQSTNDVYPTAVKVALHWAADRLLAAMAELRGAFEAKAATFAGVVKVGRTQLQDAVPMTLGQEFASYAIMLGEDERRLTEALGLIEEVNLGGTAIGTGLNAPSGYAELARRYLAEITGIPLLGSPNLIEATQDAGSFVQLSGVLKRIAVKLSKTCNDLRLLSSGPLAGLNEINLPPVQAGSSMMPGKVNPVIPEVVNQIAFEVMGNDVTVSIAAESGQLQLNAFEPIIAHALFESITHLERGCRVLAGRCVAGITANTDRLRAQVMDSIGLATALNPIIGYTQATAIAQEAASSGRTVLEVVLASGLLSRERLDELLSPEALAGETRVTDQSAPPLAEDSTGRQHPVEKGA